MDTVARERFDYASWTEEVRQRIKVVREQDLPHVRLVRHRGSYPALYRCLHLVGWLWQMTSQWN